MNNLNNQSIQWFPGHMNKARNEIKEIMPQMDVLHMNTHYGSNNHHISESCFKSFARAFRQAAAVEPREQNRVPSTKGSL